MKSVKRRFRRFRNGRAVLHSDLPGERSRMILLVRYAQPMARLSLAVALLCFPEVCRAAFFEREAGRFRVLTTEISDRLDLPSDATLEQAMSAASGWTSQVEKPFPLTKDPVQFWVKFDLPDATEPKRILINSSPWEQIEFFFLRDGQLVSRQRVGTLVPVSERSAPISMTPFFAHSGFAAVDLIPGSHSTVYARIATSQRFTPIRWLRFYLWDADQVYQGERSERLLQGIFLGIVLFLSLFNLGLFFAIRDPSYVYYGITETAGALFFASLYGLTAEYLWPRHPVLEYWVQWFAIGISGFAAGQFLRHYLQTRKYFPGADVVVRYASIGSLGFLLLPLLFFASPGLLPVGLTILGIWIALFSLVIAAVIILAYVRHHPSINNVIAAALCSVAGAIIGVAAVMGWIPSTELTVHAPQLGTCLAGVILAVGLAFRFRNLEMQLADKQLEEARSQTAHEREKLELIEEQSRLLEARVEERTAELSAAQKKSDELLANILPIAVIEELKSKGESEPRRYDEASILFADFAGFTETVATIPPKRLVQELDEIFRGFDTVISEHGLEKIKTIGDAYMAAAGLPVSVNDHAPRAVGAALALIHLVEARNRTSPVKWSLRVGVHSGAVVAGIVGKHKYAYDVWGDTVNIASRLESASEIGRVNISAYTYDQIRQNFDCEYRGKLGIKGKGDIDMYFVVRKHEEG